MKELKVKVLRTKSKSLIAVPYVGLNDLEFDLLCDVLMDAGYKFTAEYLCRTISNDQLEGEIRFLKEYLKPYFKVINPTEEV